MFMLKHEQQQQQLNERYIEEEAHRRRKTNEQKKIYHLYAGLGENTHKLYPMNVFIKKLHDKKPKWQIAKLLSFVIF